MKQPKPMKVFLWGKRLQDVYPHCSRWELAKYRIAMFMRKLSFVLLALLALYTAIQIGRHWYAIERVTLVEKDINYPILEKIAICESGNKQFGANGQVQLNANENGTVDIGVFQINNKYWGKVASDMGYNLMVEKDNRAFAEYLYSTKGTEPWFSSKKCWK